MKTSIVAVIAASLFLVAAYMGLGSRPGAPGLPQMIAISGPSSGASTPTVADLPLTLPSSPAASQVLAVGRQVVPGSLKDLAARGAPSGGTGESAAGAPAASGQQDNPTVNTTVEPLPQSAPGATAPAGNVGKPRPMPYPTLVTVPTRRPRPEPSPTPIPTPTPSPTPTPVTITVTPPVTSTATSSSPTPPPNP
jgi:hypothetical protein